MTVQFGADAGRRQRDQENWEVRDKGKAQRERERNFKNLNPVLTERIWEMHLKVSEPPSP